MPQSHSGLRPPSPSSAQPGRRPRRRRGPSSRCSRPSSSSSVRRRCAQSSPCTPVILPPTCLSDAWVDGRVSASTEKISMIFFLTADKGPASEVENTGPESIFFVNHLSNSSSTRIAGFFPFLSTTRVASPPACRRLASAPSPCPAPCTPLLGRRPHPRRRVRCPPPDGLVGCDALYDFAINRFGG